MVLSVDPRWPERSQSNWEPAPLHVPVEDWSQPPDECTDDRDERERERPAGSHVYVIDLG